MEHFVQSDTLELEVRALPLTDRPAGWNGAIGSGLTLNVAPASQELDLGEARTVTVELRGEGNVVLWPEPVIEWPRGLRVYPGEVKVGTSRPDGVLGGSKTFSYVLVADSAGRYRISGPRYAYFDVRLRRYVQLTSTPLEVFVRYVDQQPGVSVAKLPLMEEPPGMLPSVSRWPAWVRAAVLLLPPLLVLGTLAGGVLHRRLRSWAFGRPVRPRDSLDLMRAELDKELLRLVPRAGELDGNRLSAALRAAGVEPHLAAQVVRVRDRMRQERFGPPGEVDGGELQAEAAAVMAALMRDRSGRRLDGLLMAVVLALVSPDVAFPSMVQDLAPEHLYQAGAMAAAADSFANRARAEPEGAHHWYNLGAAWYAQGSAVRARAAWARAARLAPRAGQIRRALAMVSSGRGPENLLWVSPITADEAFLAAGLLWWGGWLAVLVTLSRKNRSVLGFLPLAALASAILLAGWGRHIETRYRKPVALVVGEAVLR